MLIKQYFGEAHEKKVIKTSEINSCFTKLPVAEGIAMH